MIPSIDVAIQLTPTAQKIPNSADQQTESHAKIGDIDE
jgi:hypothetical protein